MADEHELLRRWAEANDPERDPITGAEVREHDAHGRDGSPVVDLTRRRRQRRSLWAAAAAAALILGGVAGVVATRPSADRSVVAGPSTTESVEPTREGPGRLIVTNVAPERSTHIEGALGFATVTRDGEIVASAEGWATGDRKVLDEELPAGTYLIETYESGCQASCPPLDEHGVVADSADLDSFRAMGTPQSLCEAEVTVTAGSTTVIEIARDPLGADADQRCGLRVGTPARLVVSASDLPMGEEGLIHRFELSGPDGVVAEGAIANDSTSLVLDQPVTPGGYTFRWEVFDCAGSCASVGPDGRPTGVHAGRSPRLDDVGCTADVAVASEPVDLVARLGGEACRVDPVDELPRLTVPPRWSLRKPLPASCGVDLEHAAVMKVAGGMGPGAVRGAEQQRTCFRAAHFERRPMELRSTELASDGSTVPVWWRTESGQLTMFRAPRPDSDDPWTAQNCDLAEAPAPEWIAAVGCGRSQEMPVVPEEPP